MLFVTAFSDVTWHRGNLVEVRDSYGTWLDPDSIVTATPQSDVAEAAAAMIRTIDTPEDRQARKLRGAQLMALSLVNGRSIIVEWDLDLATFLENRSARMLDWIRDLQRDERSERAK